MKTYVYSGGRLSLDFRVFYHIVWYSWKNVAKGPSFREDVCTFWWPTLFGFLDVLSYFMIFLKKRNKRVIISWRRIHIFLVADSSWIFGCFIIFYDIPEKCNKRVIISWRRMHILEVGSFVIFGCFIIFYDIPEKKRNKRDIISWRRIHILVANSFWIFGCFIIFSDIPART